jgi:hypothetical protein
VKTLSTAWDYRIAWTPAPVFFPDEDRAEYLLVVKKQVLDFSKGDVKSRHYSLVLLRGQACRADPKITGGQHIP